MIVYTDEYVKTSTVGIFDLRTMDTVKVEKRLIILRSGLNRRMR